MYFRMTRFQYLVSLDESLKTMKQLITDLTEISSLPIVIKSENIRSSAFLINLCKRRFKLWLEVIADRKMVSLSVQLGLLSASYHN